MMDALNRSDIESVARLGHNMSGTGTADGFQTITDMGDTVEKSAENEDTETSRKWIGELSSYLRSIETSSLY